MDRYLDLKHLAAYSSLSVSTLHKLLPEIPHVKVGRKVLVKQSSFDYWARRRQRQHHQSSPLVKLLADEIMGAKCRR